MKTKLLCMLLVCCLCAVTLLACTPDPVPPPADSGAVSDSESAAPESESQSESETETETDSDTEPYLPGIHLDEYVIVRPETDSAEDRQLAIDLLNKLSKQGIDLSIEDDWVATPAEASNTRKEILLGKTNRPETETALEEMGEEHDFVVRFFENKIVLVGVSSDCTELAMTKFLNTYVAKATKGVLTDVLVGDLVYGTNPAFDGVQTLYGFHDYPRFARSFEESFVCNNDVVQYLYVDVPTAAVTNYGTRLENAGFSRWQSRTVNGKQLYTYGNGEGMVHVQYDTAAQRLIVTADPLLSSAYQKPQEGSWEKVTENSFAVMTLDYSNYTCNTGCDPKYDNNGLCYIITLEDGRFIVYDGGYASPQAYDYEIIYQYLVDNNHRTDAHGKPVIAAWVLTHSHADHYGAFQSFTEAHNRDVVVENFVLNTGESQCYASGHDTYLERISSKIHAYYDGAKELQPHIGQSLYFCNVEIEVMYTHEQYHFDGHDLKSENEASMVTRIHMNGMSLLLTADAGKTSSAEMVAFHGDALKSDFMQVNHHGNGGCTVELYERVLPTYVLWTTSQPGMEKRTAGSAYPVGMPSAYDASLNKRIFDETGAANNWCGDGTVEIMTFGAGKTVHIEEYTVDPALLPERIPYNP